MRTLRHRIVNVFTVGDDRLSGNPLCVFEDGRGLAGAEMQALARQLNLSETTFLLPDLRVRIFTPEFEMPFAGHPTLGSAHVARAMGLGGDKLTLQMIAGAIPVEADGDVWSLTARPPTFRAAEASRAELAAMLGLADERDVLPGARWVDTGSEQLVIPLASAVAVERCAPKVDLLRRHGRLHDGRYLAYVFAPVDEKGEDLVARFFFPVGESVVEDPATGSACANLGGWYFAEDARRPLRRLIRQGDRVGRPSRLELILDDKIRVRGRVIELGTGTFEL